ncbi:MAG: arginine--tRNA ligase [Pirellulales bacterium]|nr:arginine--tRNA ligase [Pirellulales bacterium]
MNILQELQARFRAALVGLSDASDADLDLIRPAQDPKFGDYQANLAMPLGKRLGRPPRDVAAEILGRLDAADLCHPPEVAGPGFINLRLKDDYFIPHLQAAVGDQRLGVAPVEKPRTFVIDYSAPNVAKPMHVGHIRSTVIGDALCRTLRFLGHRVISDNHIGDWGTQFGMILYGYKHFLDAAAYKNNPVAELARLYRLVSLVMEYYGILDNLPVLEKEIQKQQKILEKLKLEDQNNKKIIEKIKEQDDKVKELRSTWVFDNATRIWLENGSTTPDISKLIPEHKEIRSDVLAETAKLHAGDPENRKLWQEFLPACEDEINRIYGRLGIRFDHTLGESFYEDRLAGVVEELVNKGIARESDGALCIFFPGEKVPMLIRKQDGAFLYATTDLATIRYRMEQFHPDAILYVVDHRQSMHFKHLFEAARLWGYGDVELQHVSFGTVLGEDNRPFKTRSGDTVGLESLLDEAVLRAGEIVSANDDAKPDGPELPPERRREIAEIVGIGALKYADLSQNRTSDYVFSYDKMLAMNGNTATYMQYAYARVRSIFAKGNVDAAELRRSGAEIVLPTPAERALALEILRFPEALDRAAADYRPHQLTAYLFDLANRYSTFFENCPVLRAETDALRRSRLLLCDLTARTIGKGLELLGIKVVEKM